jgi:hypothetical protein
VVNQSTLVRRRRAVVAVGGIKLVLCPDEAPDGVCVKVVLVKSVWLVVVVCRVRVRGVWQETGRFGTGAPRLERVRPGIVTHLNFRDVDLWALKREFISSLRSICFNRRY